MITKGAQKYGWAKSIVFLSFKVVGPFADRLSIYLREGMTASASGPHEIIVIAALPAVSLWALLVWRVRPAVELLGVQRNYEVRSRLMLRTTTT